MFNTDWPQKMSVFNVFFFSAQTKDWRKPEEWILAGEAYKPLTFNWKNSTHFLKCSYLDNYFKIRNICNFTITYLVGKTNYD